MNTEHRNFLKLNFEELAKQIDLRKLLVALKPKKIFTSQMLDDILEGEDETIKKHSLLLELRTRGPDAFQKFIEVLESSGHDAVANEFKKYVNQAVPEIPTSAEVSVLKSSTGSSGSGSTGYAPYGGDISVLRVIPAKELKIGSDIYKMTSKPRGLCLLINNVKFDKLMPERLGSDEDAVRLDLVFTKLGYKVTWKNNLKAEEMRQLMKSFCKQPDHWRLDSCVVIILSHGERHCVYGTDAEPLDIYEIKQMFDNRNCHALQKKPKLFFIQACRGRTHDPGVKKADAVDASAINLYQPESEERIPTLTDMLMSFSTVDGNISIRNEHIGAWYCIELARVLAESAWELEIREILDKVDLGVQGRVANDGERQATSCEIIGWNKKFYFNPEPMGNE